MPIEVHGQNSEDVVIQFSGVLDETSSFPAFKPRLSQRLIFSCGGLTHMSSAWVQRWVKYMRGLSDKQQYVFRECPQRVVDLFNMVDGFLPVDAVVESFYVPYQCQNCQHESYQLVVRGKDFIEGQAGKSPKLLFPKEINCPRCPSSMMMSVWENIYFRFLERLNLDAKTAQTKSE